MIKFGTDGWRGVIARDFTFDNVKIVSQAISDCLHKQNRRSKKVVVGYDSRFLSKEFAKSAGLVFAANKIKVTLADRAVPTPVVSFHSLMGRYDLGIMITASHNPAYFNGLKIKTHEGAAADNSLTNRVENLLYKSKPKYMEEEDAKKKGLFEIKNLGSSYVTFLKNFVDVKKIRSLNVKILVDAMYGSGDKFVESALAKTKIKIDYLRNEFNPSFGGIHPEPVAENLRELIVRVKRGKYDLGIALDGDADRIAVVDKSGNLINAQVILPLLAIHMVKNRKEIGGIGKTVVGSSLIDKVALALGVPCYETPVGFKYISNLFKEDLICIGGEEAGGIGYRGYIPERDGSASFLLILEMCAAAKKSFGELLSALYKQYGRYHYQRISLPLKSLKSTLDNLKLPSSLYGKKVERINTLDGIKLITKDSWLMFRKSGTEPIVRVYAESRNKKEVDKLLSLGKKMIYAL
ncbi:MAG: phosphoglucomutase/phosphomannomutase family protein [Candidatus Omnitrophota bacterium]|nr:MAG: phosphoglucomutase/phosphomannomutase family protein [Candidatus Omnitrophota bacterium]